MKKWISARWIIAPKIWISIFSSWGLSVVMLIVGWKLSLIGPVLVCGSLIAEVCYTRLNWRKLFRERAPKTKIKEWIGSKPGDEKLYFETFENAEEIDNIYNKVLYALHSFDKGLTTKSNQAQSIANTSIAWIPSNDVRYAENFLQRWILFNAVAGTIIWGYGDDIYYWGNLYWGNLMDLFSSLFMLIGVGKSWAIY